MWHWSDAHANSQQYTKSGGAIRYLAHPSYWHVCRWIHLLHVVGWNNQATVLFWHGLLNEKKKIGTRNVNIIFCK